MTLLLVGAGLGATAAPHRRRAPSGCTGGVLGSLTAWSARCRVAGPC